MATWTKEQAKGSASEVVAFDNNVKAGSLLLACRDGDTEPVGVPSDTRGNTYLLLEEVTTGNGQRVGWWYAIANGAGACTVTMTAATFENYAIAEYSVDSGTITADTDATVYRSVAAGTDAVVSASVTVAEATSLGLCMYGTDTGAAPTITAGTGCVLAAQSNSGGDSLGLEAKTVGSGSQTLTWTNSGQFDGQVHIAVFKAAAAAAEKQSFYASRRRTVSR